MAWPSVIIICRIRFWQSNNLSNVLMVVFTSTKIATVSHFFDGTTPTAYGKEIHWIGYTSSPVLVSNQATLTGTNSITRAMDHTKCFPLSEPIKMTFPTFTDLLFGSFPWCTKLVRYSFQNLSLSISWTRQRWWYRPTSPAFAKLATNKFVTRSDQCPLFHWVRAQGPWSMGPYSFCQISYRRLILPISITNCN